MTDIITSTVVTFILFFVATCGWTAVITAVVCDWRDGRK